LFAEKGKVILNRKDFSFMEKVTLRGHFTGTSTDTESLVLKGLKF